MVIRNGNAVLPYIFLSSFPFPVPPRYAHRILDPMRRGKRGQPAPNGHPRAHGAVAGMVGTAAVIVIFALVHTFLRAVPFLPLALAQAVVRAAPRGFATFFIEHLGHWAIRLAALATLAVFCVIGVGLGTLIPRLSQPLRGPVRAGAAAFTVMWAGTAALYPVPAGSVPGSGRTWRSTGSRSTASCSDPRPYVP